MSAESVRAWLAEHAPELPIIETEASTATVREAAEALGVEPGRIAKTLALRVNGDVVLLVARGDAWIDNGKTKAASSCARHGTWSDVKKYVWVTRPRPGINPCPYAGDTPRRHPAGREPVST